MVTHQLAHFVQEERGLMKDQSGSAATKEKAFCAPAFGQTTESGIAKEKKNEIERNESK
jgi:hypothetical protein